MARLQIEALSAKLGSLGLRAFQCSVREGSSWVAFAHQGEFYFVRITSLDHLTTLDHLIDAAEASGEAAESLVEQLAVPSRLMPSVRDPVDPDNMIIIRKRWAQERAAGMWVKTQARQPKRSMPQPKMSQGELA
jgi:hypothetical protein